MRISCRPLAGMPDADYSRLTGRSFFASRGFAELWGAMGGHPMVWTCEREGALAAVLPAVEYGFGPFMRCISMPDGCYGGLYVDPDLQRDRDAIGRELLEAISRAGYAKTCIFDFDSTLPHHGGFEPEILTTTLVEIGAPGWSPPDAKLRSEIRKAGREGVAIERFSWERHGDGFLALAAATARRHGRRPRYRARFFRRLARLAERDSRVLWRHCEHDGQPVASHIYFVEDGMLQLWQSYSDRRFSYLKANQYLCFTMCREAADRGMRWLNLGATPVGAQGLEHFKQRWGGIGVRYFCHARWEGLGRLAARRHLRSLELGDAAFVRAAELLGGRRAES